MVWHYQTSPNDPFDYDNVQSVILAEINSGGSQPQSSDAGCAQRVLYVIDPHQWRALGGEQICESDLGGARRHGDGAAGVVRADQEDSGSCREDSELALHRGGGATNWYPPSYSPLTGLMYVNSANIGVEYEPLPLEELRKLNLAAGGPLRRQHDQDDEPSSPIPSRAGI